MSQLKYDKRDGLAPGSFPFLHKPSGTHSKPSVQISLHNRRVISAIWISDSGVWWLGQTHCKIKSIFLWFLYFLLAVVSRANLAWSWTSRLPADTFLLKEEHVVSTKMCLFRHQNETLFTANCSCLWSSPFLSFPAIDIKAWTILTLELPILGMWVTANRDEWGSYCFRLSSDSRGRCIC